MKNFFKNIFKKSAGKYSLYKSIGLQGDTVLSAEGYLRVNEISLYVNRGINKRAEKVGQVEFILKDLKGNVIENHPLLNLLDKPNEEMMGNTFWKLASIYRDTTGFALIKKVGNEAVFKENQKIKSLELINSQGVTINYEDNKIKSFTVIDEITGKSETLLFDQCIYWVNPNPRKSSEGISLLRAGLYSIDTDNELNKYQNAVIKNGGMVDSVFSFKNTLSKEQLDNLKDTYKEEYSEAQNAGRPLFLGGDTTYEKLGLTPAELSYMESRRMMIDDMVVVTGVPKSLLGITSGDTFANAEIAYKIFLRETVKPIIEDLVNVLDWKLVPDNLELSFVDPTPEDQESKLNMLETADRVNALTTNEKRELLGYDPIVGYDVIQERNNRPEMAKGFKDVFVHPLRNKDFRHKYFDVKTKSLDKRKQTFKKKVNKYFKDQEQRILDKIKVSKSLKNKNLDNELFDTNFEIGLAVTLLDDIKKIAQELGQETYDYFNINYDYYYSSSLDQAIDQRFNFWVNSVNETTANQITETITEWGQSDETIADLNDRVKEIYTKLDDYRINTIVNTELATVNSLATFDAYKQVGIKTKIWVWSAGIKGGVRDDHLALDGEEVPIDQPFSNGMMYPHDPSADAGDTINCECFI